MGRDIDDSNRLTLSTRVTWVTGGVGRRVVVRGVVGRGVVVLGLNVCLLGGIVILGLGVVACLILELW